MWKTLMAFLPQETALHGKVTLLPRLTPVLPAALGASALVHDLGVRASAEDVHPAAAPADHVGRGPEGSPKPKAGAPVVPAAVAVDVVSWDFSLRPTTSMFPLATLQDLGDTVHL